MASNLTAILTGAITDTRRSDIIANKILSILDGWKPTYGTFTIRMLEESFGCNNATASLIIRQVDIKFQPPKKLVIERISVCKRCKHGFYAYKKTDNYILRVCQSCLVEVPLSELTLSDIIGRSLEEFDEEGLELSEFFTYQKR